jgi:MinD-like ATPase involved in chromosome partitioning or flagellar assembly
VTDEHADRVYVPGTNPTPPDRDVEPFWEDDEVEAPVHGRPVPHQAPPPVPVPGPQGVPGVQPPPTVYRPVPAPPTPPVTQIPPATQIPVPRPPVQTPSPVSSAPSSNDEGVHGGPDSPWSQPPQRPPAPLAEPDTGPAPLAEPDTGPTPAARASAAVPPPPSSSPPPAPSTPVEPPNGAIYRPPAQGSAAVPPAPVMPPYQGPPQAPPPPPGPYPPTMDPRALPPQQARGPVQPGPPPAQQPPPPGPAPVDPFQDLPWVSDGTPTAEEFARRRLAKPAEPTATMGARAMLNKTAMGLVRLAPSKREQEFKQDVEMVRRNFGGLRQVTVVNPKGGAGKTVAVLLLAMTFGQKRGGYVLAWDNNETQGTLGMRAQQDFHARTVRDMMRDLHLFRGSHGRVGDLSQYVRAQGEGMFDVLASDESATAGEMLTAGAFAEIREIVSRFYKLIFVDTGNNVRAQNWQAAIDATDQLVISMSARNDSAETAARMLDHLEQSGRQRLVRQAVTVVSLPPTRKDIDLPAIQRHFAARTRAVMMSPYEKLIDSGEPLRYGQLSANTKDAWLKIAAAVAEGL